VTPAELGELEQAWTGRQGPPGIGWIPYPLPQFRILLAAAMGTFTSAPSFCDFGAGIGTKVLTAAQMGCRPANGCETFPAYLAEARRIHADVVRLDVRACPAAGHHIVYLNHPLADATEERALEARIAAELSPGCVLIGVHLLSPAPCGAHWETICTTRDGRAWVARKTTGGR